MNKLFQYNLLALAISSLFLASCGDAETTLVEKDPILVEDDDDDHDDEFTIESMGRLAVLPTDSDEAVIFDLDDGDELESFTLTYSGNALTASANYRYAVIASRSNDYVGFIDSGLWREDHGAHLHDYKQSPAMSDFELTGSRPTHIVTHEDQMVVFYDGDSETGALSSVQVLTDSDISSEATEIASLDYAVNMHGVAKPQGDHLFATVRRDDADSTSAAKVLPDQVAVYHLHDDEYEQEHVLEVNCPDLHGAAQNEEFVVFGCADGILVSHEHDEEFEAEKIANIDDVEDLRIGTIFGHEELDSFIGVASAHGGSHAILFGIDPVAMEMEKLEWQPVEGASPVSYAFSHEGEHFLVLDSSGHLNILSAHDHDGETHWELEERLDISDEDVATMPEGMSFNMTVSQNGQYVYVSDPIAKHVLQIDLETATVTDDIEMTFAVSDLTWLGIAEEEHDHDEDEDDHDH